MKKDKIALLSCATLVAAGIGLNIHNALADYGIGENSFALVAVGPGSNSGSNSNSNTNPTKWMRNVKNCPTKKIETQDEYTMENTEPPRNGGPMWHCVERDENGVFHWTRETEVYEKQKYCCPHEKGFYATVEECMNNLDTSCQ